jgi:hypothetical protein
MSAQGVSDASLSDNTQMSLRKVIIAIQTDKSLTSQQKAIKIQVR